MRKRKEIIIKIKIQISPDIEETYAVIYANAMTEEIQQLADKLNSFQNVITAIDKEQIVVLSTKRLCEMEKLSHYYCGTDSGSVSCWSVYVAHYRLLARNMNKKIEEKNS